MKNRTHRYNINRPRHWHKYIKYKICLSIMMAICIKQHLSNILSSSHENVKQHWGWVDKKKGVQNFDFLEKGLGLVSSPHFVNDFLKKNVSHVIFY